jgi:hypothetical protein
MQIDSQVEKVHAEHSYALAEAQLLERYLAQFVFAYDLSRVPTSESEHSARFVPQCGLGRLIQSLEAKVSVPVSLQTRLEAARRNRNRLAHQYFFDRSDSMQTCNGRSEMIHELDELGEEFYQLWGYFDEALVAWLQGELQTREALLAEFARSVCK